MLACDCSAPLPAHLEHVTGDRILVACRGCHRVVEHVVPAGGDAAADRLPVRGRVYRLPGQWPRHHAFVDGWLLVALQHSDEVVALGPDGTVTGRVTVPAPACVLPG